MQASPMISSDDSALQSPVLSPKAMGLVIMHHCLTQLPGYDPEGYTSLFPWIRSLILMAMTSALVGRKLLPLTSVPAIPVHLDPFLWAD